MSASYWSVAGATKPRRLPPFEQIDKDRRAWHGRARGRVFKIGETWHYEVIANGRVVNADNTNHWRSMFDGCLESTAAFDHVLFTGHRLKDKTWAAVVDRTSD